MQSTAMTSAGRLSKEMPNVGALCDLAGRGLLQMLDPQSRLFCDRLKKSERGLEREGISRRYTMMTLLGLHRLEVTTGIPSSINVMTVLEVLLQDTNWLTGAGDLGLLLWACAEIAPTRLPQICEGLSPRGALHRYPDGRNACTMEVAWLLAGIAHCALAGYDNIPGLMDEGSAAFEVLKLNGGASGIFRHLAKGRTIPGFFRSRIGSFADQVYPIYALSMFARACNSEEAQQMALRTARTICELQGPQGEWSWHYDSSTGRVVSRYPVYSVHQHAMAPMALFAVGDATGEDFSDFIYKGLSWISGNNELGMNFVEPSHDLIWRCLYLGHPVAYVDSALRLLGMKRGSARSVQLKIKYECRPYELGWLLYAFAGQACAVASR